MHSPYVLGAETGDEASFWNAWPWIKKRITTLRNLPAELTRKQHVIAVSAAAAGKAGDTKTQQALKASVLRLGIMLTTADKIKATIDEWLPKWQQVEAKESGTALSGWTLIVLGVAGIAAAAWVAYAGAGLLSEYANEKRIVADVEAGRLTITQAQTLIKAGQKPTTAEAFAGGLAGAAVPIAIVLGLAALGMMYLRPTRGAVA